MACQFLEKQGLILVEKNYRCYQGEIDLIMKANKNIVFVEVRSRSRSDYGHPAETVTPAKIKKIIRAGSHYLQKTNLLYRVTSRYDIIAIHLRHNEPQIDWIPNAFNADW